MISAELSLLYPANDLYIKNNIDSVRSSLYQLTSRFFQYPTKLYMYQGLNEQSPTIDDYLTQSNIKISRLLTDIVDSSIISESNLLDEGWWEFIYELQDDSFDYVFYHFKLVVIESGDSDINPSGNIVVESNSVNIDNWYYEEKENVFSPIPLEGVSSSYLNRRIKYISPDDEYLIRGETYSFQITPYNVETGMEFETRTYNNIIYT